jgi:hypothetical protein
LAVGPAERRLALLEPDVGPPPAVTVPDQVATETDKSSAEIHVASERGSVVPDAVAGPPLETSPAPAAASRPPVAIAVGELSAADGPPAASLASIPFSDPGAGPAETAEMPRSPAVPPSKTAPAEIPDFTPRKLDPEEIAMLVKRAEQFLAFGDIASARLMLKRAAEGGNAHAAMVLATTYADGVQSAPEDLVLARAWYNKARSLGSTDATDRLRSLASQH